MAAQNTAASFSYPLNSSSTISSIKTPFKTLERNMGGDIISWISPIISAMSSSEPGFRTLYRPMAKNTPI